MARVIAVLLGVFALLPVTADAATAQVRRTAIGAGIGFVGGSVITLSAIVARARFQRKYLDSVDDLIHWQSAPMIAAPAAGVVFGLAGDEALVGSVVGSTTGLAAGAAVGAGLGWLLSTQPEWPWAGGVIGAGVGLTIGGLAGGLIAWSRDEAPSLSFPSRLRFAISVPVP